MNASLSVMLNSAVFEQIELDIQANYLFIEWVYKLLDIYRLEGLKQLLRSLYKYFIPVANLSR